jgi:hypothetical protein
VVLLPRTCFVTFRSTYQATCVRGESVSAKSAPVLERSREAQGCACPTHLLDDDDTARAVDAPEWRLQFDDLVAEVEVPPASGLKPAAPRSSTATARAAGSAADPCHDAAALDLHVADH